MHLYALGGGRKEIKELLIMWLMLSANWLREAYGSGWLAQRIVREWDWQPKGPRIMEALISQLKCAWETPCINAVKRNHKDALQVLMSHGHAELARQYHNSVDCLDTFLHCYVKSKENFDPTPNGCLLSRAAHLIDW